ncbi:MAG: DinB family protein [Bdellovibrionales bacterium]|nr:DinB family protein [Bdellovibrionales bacterium]
MSPSQTAFTPAQPKLAPPGAGLPWWEHLIARWYLFPKFCRQSTWESALALFQRETTRIDDLVAHTPGDQFTSPILVTGVRGIEDSSRYWSVALTLEHLIIVTRQFTQVVVDLGEGRIPNGKASTAAVKPQGANPTSLLVDFDRASADFHRRALSEVKNRQSPTTFAHPWFGQLTAYKWVCIAAMHHGIHRRQIEAIHRGLPIS